MAAILTLDRASTQFGLFRPLAFWGNSTIRPLPLPPPRPTATEILEAVVVISHREITRLRVSSLFDQIGGRPPRGPSLDGHRFPAGWIEKGR